MTMNHSNLSQSSLNDNNYFDISIGRNSSSGVSNNKKKFQSIYTPKRVGSLTSLSGLNESKRPGDYYIQKISNSSLNLNAYTNTKTSGSSHGAINANGTRPASGDSILSLQSNFSDETSSVGSSQFEVPDSRLSSLTSYSMISRSVSPSTNNYNFTKTQSNDKLKGKINEENENEVDNESEEDQEDDIKQMNSSLSTITLKNSYKNDDQYESRSDLTYSSPSQEHMTRSNIKSLSTSNIVQQKYPRRLTSVKSTTSLTRSKTRYINDKKTKERQQLRKKLYEENENDDEILTNDLDLVFNVPIIKNHAELYMNHNNTSNLLSRHDLISTGDDTKYNINKNTAVIKPCPLPGKLGSQIDLTNTSTTSKVNTIPEDTITEENVANSFINDNDSEITRNISTFYNQRSTSFSKLVKLSREQNMMYKLPTFIKSQSSIEDLHLISPEKLNFVDQTRPINLPPKTTKDKSKHNKEFQKVLTNYEINTKLQNVSRKKSMESLIANQQQWVKVMSSIDDEKEFNRIFSKDKYVIRKLCWESICPDKLRFEFFRKILMNNCNKDLINSINTTFKNSDFKFNNLNESIKINKDIEFNRLIELIFQRPLFDSIVKELNENDKDFSIFEFKENFKYLLYIKSFSENGLHKHDEIFLIPILLILFQNNRSLQEIYLLVELINHEIFNHEFLNDLSNSLQKWSNLDSSYSSSSLLYKFLYKFENLKEFEHLNSNKFFDILIQLNDKLPLSLSAPSTPIINQSGNFSFHNISNSNSSSEDDALTNTNSAESIREFYINSSSLNLVLKLLQLLIIYSNSPRTKQTNNLKIVQTFLIIIFKYYHINWNDFDELIKVNKSIRLNNNSDQAVNLSSFVDKWKEVFRKF